MKQVLETEAKDIFLRGAPTEVVKIDEAARTVELSFASETPVDRWFGIEILEMTPRAADLKRLNNGGALLADHNIDAQIGSVVRAWIGDDKRAHAIVKFSRKQQAEDEFQDVIDGIRTNVSFKYRVLNYKTEKGQGNAPDKRTVTQWEAYEISLVAVPADPSVGVGRAQEQITSDAVEQVEITESRDAETAAAENTKLRSKIMDNQTNITPGEGQPTITFAREDQILAYGQKFGADINLTREIANDPNGTVEMLRDRLAAQYKSANPIPTSPETPASNLNLTPKEKKRYSISRAILAQADNDWSRAEFEYECHREIETRLNRASSGFFVPSDIQNDKDIEARDLSVAGGGAAGAYLVSTDHMPQSFIELLRSKAIMLSQAGVQVMSDLVGNPSIPRQDSSSTGYWISEGQPPTKSQLGLGQLQMSPKTCGARTEFTRQLLIQSAPSIDQLVKSDIAAVLARTIDSAIIQGSGSAGQPTGIMHTTGVDDMTMAGSAFAWEDAVAFETAIAEGNAPEATKFVVRPSIVGTLKTRPKIGTTYPVYLLENNQLNGYEVAATTQMPANTILFGDFSTVILGEWGILEIEANKYGTTFGAGGIEVRGLHMVDVAVRYPQALKQMTTFA